MFWRVSRDCAERSRRGEGPPWLVGRALTHEVPVGHVFDPGDFSQLGCRSMPADEVFAAVARHYDGLASR